MIEQHVIKNFFLVYKGIINYCPCMFQFYVRKENNANHRPGSQNGYVQERVLISHPKYDGYNVSMSWLAKPKEYLSKCCFSIITSTFITLTFIVIFDIIFAILFFLVFCYDVLVCITVCFTCINRTKSLSTSFFSLQLN